MIDDNFCSAVDKLTARTKTPRHSDGKKAGVESRTNINRRVSEVGNVLSRDGEFFCSRQSACWVGLAWLPRFIAADVRKFYRRKNFLRNLNRREVLLVRANTERNFFASNVVKSSGIPS